MSDQDKEKVLTDTKKVSVPPPPIEAPPTWDSIAQPHRESQDERESAILDSEGHRVILNKPLSQKKTTIVERLSKFFLHR